MPVFRLNSDQMVFPPPHMADDSGLLAVGGDFHPERMLLAYSMGIFPWSEYAGQPFWYCPDPRMILTPETLQVRRSTAKIIRRGDFEVRLDTAFSEVVGHCSATPRPGQDGTWITERYVQTLTELHRAGLAHSAEAWQEGQLVGGVYGLCLGGVFFGESMFAHRPNASKVAFITLIRQLAAWDIGLIDCQVHTEHLATFGAHEVPRRDFLERLHLALDQDTRRGPWALTIGAQAR